MKRPFYRIWVGSKEISEHVSSVVFTNAITQDNTLDFVGSDAFNFVPLLDTDLKIGAVVEFMYGYAGGVISDKFSFSIFDIEVTYAETITGTIKCHDSGIKPRRAYSKAIFEDSCGSDIAQVVAKDHGLRYSGVFNSGPKLKFIPQGNKSDFQLLQYTARREGMIVYMLNDELYYGPRRMDSDSIKTYVYGRDLMKFTPKMKASASKGNFDNPAILDSKVTIRPDEVNTGDAAPTSTETPLAQFQMVFDENADFVKNEKSAVPNVVECENETEAKNVRASIRSADSANSLEAELNIEMDPLIKPNEVISILGVAERFSGNWWVTAIKTSLEGAGGTAVIVLSKNAVKIDTGKRVGEQTEVNTSEGPENCENEKEVFVYDVNADRVE